MYLAHLDYIITPLSVTFSITKNTVLLNLLPVYLKEFVERCKIDTNLIGENFKKLEYRNF